MANLEFLVEKEVVPRLERIAHSLELIAGVVDEIYREERLKEVPAREVTKISSAPAPPRVPRARANL